MAHARRGLAALFGKAAMPPTAPDEEEDVLEHDLDEDFVDYDEAVELANEDEEEDEVDEEALEAFDEEDNVAEEDAPLPEAGEAEAYRAVSKADELVPTDATPILRGLLEKIESQDARLVAMQRRQFAMQREQRAAQQQQREFAKAMGGFMDAYEEDMETLSKAVQVVRRKADEQPRPARSGQRRKHAPASGKTEQEREKKPFAPEQKQAIFAKAAAAPDLFGASDISKLESRLNLAAQTGDARYVTGGGPYGAPLSPEQLTALELV